MTPPHSMNATLADRLPDIRRVCRELQVERLSVFGSAVTADFRPDSDVDVLVEFVPGTDLGPWLSRLTRLQTALAVALRRNVDVVTEAALRDPHFRQEAEKTLTLLFDARQVA